jgi:pyridoxal phosphate enzyme (YggS family)
MSSISDNLQAVHRAIDEAASAVSRTSDAVTLLAVSKTFGIEAVLDAARAGQRAFGENYVQEAVDKIDAAKKSSPSYDLEWHFIGPIQSNKTRLIAEHFDWVHSVDREKIALRLSEQRPHHLQPLQLCLQVNISSEASKSGAPIDDSVALARIISVLPNIRLRGLMAIPEPSDDIAQQRAAFSQVRTLFQQCRDEGIDMDTLSMGMSADLTSAIAEGATIVRVGNAIFGKRTYEQ